MFFFKIYDSFFLAGFTVAAVANQVLDVNGKNFYLKSTSSLVKAASTTYKVSYPPYPLCSTLNFIFFPFRFTTTSSFTIIIYDYNGLPRSSTPSVGAYEYLYQKGVGEW